MNIIKYIANKTGKQELMDNPSDVKNIDTIKIKQLVKEHFHTILKKLKKIEKSKNIL